MVNFIHLCNETTVVEKTRIQVDKSTAANLSTLKSYGDSYDDVISDLLAFFEDVESIVQHHDAEEDGETIPVARLDALLERVEPDNGGETDD